MNKVAIVFWAITTIIGYLADDFHGALIGLLIGLSMSVIAEFIPGQPRRRR